MGKVVYLNNSGFNTEDLRVESELTDLIYKRMLDYEKGFKSKLRSSSTAVVFICLAFFWSRIADSVYIQGIGSLSLGLMLVISSINLALVFVGTFLGYNIVFNLLKIVSELYLYLEGVYFHRRVSSYVTLKHKVSNSYYTEMFFVLNGVTSKVVVSNYYASMHNVGDKVPVKLSYMMYKTQERFYVVTECIGSRADTVQDFVRENELFYVEGRHNEYLDNMRRVSLASSKSGLGISGSGTKRLEG